MLTDAHNLAGGTTCSTDICIVGAGVAGITLAMQLARGPARVLLLEGGGLTFTKSLHSLPAVLSRPLWGEQGLAHGRNVGHTYYPLRLTRGRALGGSSRAWASHGLQAAPLDAVDFIERDGLPDHGWPFGQESLAPYAERAQRACNLGPFEYEAAPWEARGLGGRLPLNEEMVRSTMFQFGLNSAFNRYQTALAEAENLQLLLHATVTRIAIDHHGRVRHVKCATLNGNRFTIKADRFILAAGAIENARLLLVSNDVERAGIGNEHDLVGRYFQEHLDAEIGMFIPAPDLDLDALRLYTSQQIDPQVNTLAMLRLNDEVLKREGLLNAVVRLRPTQRSTLDPAFHSARTLRRSLHHGLPNAGLASHAVRAALGVGSLVQHRVTRSAVPDAFRLDIMAEQMPNPESRVRLDNGRRDRLGLPSTALDWRLRDHDWHSIRRTVEILADCVRDAGIGEIISTGGGRTSRPVVYGNWHHLGTTRMHVDPARGVVDENCRVHSVSNLYISGGSILPTSGYANPTLTITALALRLADHLQTLS